MHGSSEPRTYPSQRDKVRGDHAEIPCHLTKSGEYNSTESLDITQLMLELEAKACMIEGLEKTLMNQQEQSQNDLLRIEERLNERSVQYLEEVATKNETINDLESQLRRGRLEADTSDIGPEAKVATVRGREEIESVPVVKVKLSRKSL